MSGWMWRFSRAGSPGPAISVELFLRDVGRHPDRLVEGDVTRACKQLRTPADIEQQPDQEGVPLLIVLADVSSDTDGGGCRICAPKIVVEIARVVQLRVLLDDFL